jgi:hypothetical protein
VGATLATGSSTGMFTLGVRRTGGSIRRGAADGRSGPTLEAMRGAGDGAERVSRYRVWGAYGTTGELR